MAGILRIIVAAAIGLFALLAGLFAALLLTLAALVSLFRPRAKHSSTAPEMPRAGEATRQRPTREPAGDVIDIEATQVETKRDLP
ncbi:MAG: hypothetical protein C0518_02325 [Opitutus sp.]|nr:hypothetical protein [Opitutus sp.]